MSLKKTLLIVLLIVAMSSSCINHVRNNDKINQMTNDYPEWKRIVDNMKTSEDLDYQNFLLSYSRTVKNREQFLRYLYGGWNRYGSWYDLTIIRSFLSDDIQFPDDSDMDNNRELKDKTVRDLNILNDPLFVRRLTCYDNYRGPSVTFDILYSVYAADIVNRFDIVNKDTRKNGTLDSMCNYMYMCGIFGRSDMVQFLNSHNVGVLNASMVQYIKKNHDKFVFDNYLGCYVVGADSSDNRKSAIIKSRMNTQAFKPFPDWSSDITPISLYNKDEPPSSRRPLPQVPPVSVDRTPPPAQ